MWIVLCVSLVFGLICVRIWCEAIIVFFNMAQSLASLDRKTKAK